jgi:type IV pilus assembly protein PilX
MRKQTMHLERSSNKQKGAALIVGLVLLLVLTVLGISGMNTALLEMTMAGNTQAAQLSFQAAETGIDVAMSGNVSTSSPVTYTDIGMDDDDSYSFTASIVCAGTTPVPEGIYSENGSARAIHFDATSTGVQTVRNARSVHTQSVYIVGPDPENPNFDPAVSVGSC